MQKSGQPHTIAADAAIYSRVSAVSQEDGYSLDNQERACRAYAAQHGLTVIATYSDTFSGADLDARPGLSRCLDAMDNGTFTNLIIFDPDRFSRDMVHTLYLLHRCERANVSLQFVNFDFENDSTGRLMLTVRAYAAELERTKIKSRTRSGIAAKVRSGKLTGRGRAPYGYQYAEQERRGTLVADPTTASIVAELFMLYADGLSLLRVAATLTERGYTPPRGGQAWAYTGVREILLNRAYIGEASALKTRTTTIAGKQITKRLDASEHTTIPCPPLISREIFEAAQARLARNRAESVRTNQHPEQFLLRAGYARCGHCGKPLVTTWESADKHGNRTPIYRAQPSRHHGCGEKKCGPSVRAAILDRVAWDAVEEYLTTPDNLAVIWGDGASQADPFGSALAENDSALSRIAKRQQTVARRAAAIDDDDAAEPLLTELKVLSEQRKVLIRKQEELEAQRKEQSAEQDRQIGLIALWRNAAALDTASYAGKREALAALGIRALVYGRDDYKIVAPPAVNSVTLIGNS